MEILFDKDKKKNIRKKFLSSNMLPKVLNALSWIALAVGIIFAIVFVVMVLSSSSSVSINTYVKAITIFLYGFIFFVIFKSLVFFKTLKNLMERKNEQLIMKNDAFKYCYKVLIDSAKNERIVIFIPFDRINSVTYNGDSKELAFYGTIFAHSYKNYFKDEEPDAEETIDNFIIYDYFEKSFLDLLKEKNIEVTMI